jgi:hypothetical protein
MIAIFMVMIVFAIIGGFFAKSKGRDPLGWALICGMTGIIGIIVLAFMSNGNEAQVAQGVFALAVRYDEKKWSVLADVDPDIRAAIARVEPYGAKWTAVLAEKYLAVADKTYLEALVENVIAEAKAAPAEPIKGTIGPSEFRRQPDGSYAIVGGAFVGQRYKSYNSMVTTYAKSGEWVIKSE